MTEIEIVILLLAVVAAITVIARRIGVPYPILMVIAGLGLGYVLGLVPDLPQVELAPEIVLLLFLPPILFAAAVNSSPRELWRNVRPISFLALGLVLTTIFAVAAVTVALVPGIGWPAALTLGAIVSPTDAIAATAIAQRLGAPRRLVTVLEGESLVNDATALLAYRLAVAAAISGVALTPAEVAIDFVVLAAGGVAIGLVVGWVTAEILARLDDPPVEVLISLVAPFAAYLPAEQLGVSGVLAAVSAGLLLGFRSSRISSSDTRILGFATWQMTTFVVNGLAFLLVGLQLPSIMDAIGGRPPSELIGIAAALIVTVIGIRLAWVFPAAYIPRWLFPAVARRDPIPPNSVIFVLGWAGLRGAVSLAAALALPPEFPERGLIIFLTFAVILATLVGQGLTLPALIRWLRIGDDGTAAHEEVHARVAANEAALRRLDELVTEVPGHVPLIDQLREQHTHLAEHYGHDHDVTETPVNQEELDHETIRRAVLVAKREAVLNLRDSGVISDSALRSVERDLDLEEVRREL